LHELLDDLFLLFQCNNIHVYSKHFPLSLSLSHKNVFPRCIIINCTFSHNRAYIYLYRDCIIYRGKFFHLNFCIVLCIQYVYMYIFTTIFAMFYLQNHSYNAKKKLQTKFFFLRSFRYILSKDSFSFMAHIFAREDIDY